MAKFNLSLIPKRFNKKISVADIKQYLVDEMKQTREQQNAIYNLQDELKKAKEYEVKYDLTLVTLDEYKTRLKSTKDRIKILEQQINDLQKKIKEDVYKINSLTLENKKMEKHCNNIEKDLRKEFIREYKEKISELKGHIKKTDLLKIFK